MDFVRDGLLDPGARPERLRGLIPGKFDSLQLTVNYRVSTPVNWQRGEDVIIAGSVSNDEAKTIYPRGWDAEDTETLGRWAPPHALAGDVA